MVIKKPYGFLIKHFRIIHLVLSILLIYITYKSSAVYTFFNNYVKEGHYTFYIDLSSRFINYYMFLITILIILFGIVLYFLLKWKDKKRLFYVLLCIFYLFIFIIFIYMFDVLQNVQTTIMDMRTIRLTRDFALIATFPQYIFVAFTILRGIGFDIKKFGFNKDIVDLNINVKDTEEIELILAQDTYKYMRSIRRFLREVRYFALENRFFFVVIILVVALGTGLSLYLNVKVYNKTYVEKEEFIADSLNVIVDKTYISSIDYNGNIINKNKAYIIVQLNIKNNSNEKQKLKTDNYRLIIDDETYYPNLSKGNYFLDLGDSYLNEIILPGEYYNYLFIYEMDINEINKKITFRIVNDVRTLQGEIDADYKDVNITPIKLNEIIKIGENVIKESINLSDSSLKKSSIKINSYSLASSFSESYKYCSNDKCFEGVKVIKPEITGLERILLRLDTNLAIDETLFISKYITTSNDFMKYFATVNYTLNNKVKTVKINSINSEYVKDSIVFLEVPKEIQNASSIKLYLTIRTSRYEIVLK